MRSSLVRRALNDDDTSPHIFRHLRLVVVGSAHVWIKTSLLTMTWSRATYFERFNIVVPLLPTAARPSAPWKWETVAIKMIRVESFSCCEFFIFFPIMAVSAIPGLVVLACAARLAGIAFLPLPLLQPHLRLCSVCLLGKNQEIEDACNCDPPSHAR